MKGKYFAAVLLFFCVGMNAHADDYRGDTNRTIEQLTDIYQADIAADTQLMLYQMALKSAYRDGDGKEFLKRKSQIEQLAEDTNTEMPIRDKAHSIVHDWPDQLMIDRLLRLMSDISIAPMPPNPLDYPIGGISDAAAQKAFESEIDKSLKTCR